MYRRITEILISIIFFLLIATYIATGWMVPSTIERPISAAILATAILLACSFLLYFLHRRILSGAGMAAAIFFLLLAGAAPKAFWFTPFHGTVLLMAMTLYFHICFHAVRPSLEYLSLQWIALGSASLITPSLLWLVPVLTLSSVGMAKDKWKFWFTLLLALLFPFAVFIGIRYMNGGGASIAAYLTDLWSGMKTLHLPSFNLPVITLFRIMMTIVFTTIAIFRIASRLSTYKTAHYHAFIHLIILAICISVLAVLFMSDPATPSGMLVTLPIAPLLGECFTNSRNKMSCRLMLVILALILIAERIAYFV